MSPEGDARRQEDGGPGSRQMESDCEDVPPRQERPLLLRNRKYFILSPSPAVVVEIAEPIEAALQVFRSAALCLRNALPGHIPAPLEMPSRIVVPGWPL